MSDIGLPTGAPDEFPVDPTTGAPTGTPVGGLTVVARAIYNLRWLGSPSYVLGADMSIGWEFTREDGGNVEIPTGATITFTDSSGARVSTPATPDLDSAIPSPALKLTTQYLFGQLGALDIEISVIVGTDPSQQDVRLKTRVTVN